MLAEGMLAELLATDGVDEIWESRSRVGVMAFHGGSLEVVTDTIAAEVAERSAASLYAIRQPWSLRWHIPSNAMDPADSPALQAFLAHVDSAIAIHGWGTDGWTPDSRRPSAGASNTFRFSSDGVDRPILVGGRNRELAGRVAEALRAALPSYDVVDDLERIPPSLRGLDPRNLVNRVRDGGVQLELTPRVRGLPPFWEKDQRGTACPDTQALIEALASAITR
jgi:phage replication-related protein YjqB (UPF0714/DUF867 family)